LKKYDIGANAAISYDSTSHRIAFISSFKNIVIHPTLHVPNNRFFGASNKTIKLAKIMSNILTYCTDDWSVYRFDVLTGKFLTKDPCRMLEVIQQYQEYDNY
jgi:hypothetical protein